MVVDRLPPSPQLTRVCNLLATARELVADYVDGQVEATPLLRMPKIGDSVFYSYASHDLDGDHQHLVGAVRPAVIVRDFSGGHPSQTDPTIPCFNLHVFTDFENDGVKCASGSFWATSRQLADAPTPGRFHWPEKEV